MPFHYPCHMQSIRMFFARCMPFVLVAAIETDYFWGKGHPFAVYPKRPYPEGVEDRWPKKKKVNEEKKD